MDRKEGTFLKRKNGISVTSVTSVTSLPSYSDKGAGSSGQLTGAFGRVRPSFAARRLLVCALYAGIILAFIFSPFMQQTANAENETGDSQMVVIGDTVTMPDYTRVGYTLLGFSQIRSPK